MRCIWRRRRRVIRIPVTTVDATDAAGSGAGESRWSTRGISWSRRAAGSGQM